MDCLPYLDVRQLLSGLLESHLFFWDSVFTVPFLVFELLLQLLCILVRIFPTPPRRLRHRLCPPPILRCKRTASLVIDPSGILKEPDDVPANRVLDIKRPPISLDVVVVLTKAGQIANWWISVNPLGGSTCPARPRRQGVQTCRWEMRFKALNDRRRYMGKGQRFYACPMNIPWDYIIPILSAAISSIVSIFIMRHSNKRRDRERREQLQREDYERQRLAVANCIRKLRETEAKRKAFPPDLDKLQNLFDQYRYYLKNLGLDVTHPEVCKCLEECFEKIGEAESTLWEFRRINEGKGWPTSAVTNVIEECPEALHRSAKEHLYFPYDK